MAWTAPKVDWDAADGVLYSDLNEIGENLVYLKAHADQESGVHGSTSAATPSKLVERDADGRAKFAAPDAEDDVALKSNVTSEATTRAAADAALQAAIDLINGATGMMPIAGGTFTGPVVMSAPDTSYTTALGRNIKLLTSVPALGDLANGEIAFVYEVP